MLGWLRAVWIYCAQASGIIARRACLAGRWSAAVVLRDPLYRPAKAACLTATGGVQSAASGDPVRPVRCEAGRSALRRVARQKARACRLGRHRQQDRADRMGGHGARRRLRTRACADADCGIDQALAGHPVAHHRAAIERRR